MNEIIEKRTKHAKHFDLGGGKRQAIITKHPQHYQKEGQWQDIRTDWVLEKGFGQKMQQAQHHLRLFNDGKEKLRFGFAKGVYVDYELPAALGITTKDAAKSGAWTNADLRYTATPEGIKGEIILQAAGHPASFSFPLSAVGCTPVVEGNSLVYYTDGKAVGRVNAPYMEDAKGEIGAVKLSYDGEQVTFTPDAKWLEGAAYPVTIDPTTTIQPDGAAGKDTFVWSYNVGATAGTNVRLETGYYLSGYHRSLLQFDLASVPSGVMITSGVLYLYCNYVDSASASSTAAYKITEDWDEALATWDNQPAHNVSPETTTDVAGTGVWYGWDISSLVGNWFSGSAANYGVKIFQTAMSRKRFYSSDYTDDTSLRPKLVVEYTEPPREGGSESTVTVTAESAGAKTGIGASEADTTVTVSGAGTKEGIAPTSEPTVTVVAEGAGVKAASGASETTVTVGVESGGEAYFVMPPEITIEQVGSKIRLSW